MGMQETIERKLRAGVPALVHMEVLNESHRHNVPPGSESHFNVVLVAGAFDGVRLLERHRMIHRILVDEMAQGVHALALHSYTPGEWAAKTGKVPASPPCLGGGTTAAS